MCGTVEGFVVSDQFLPPKQNDIIEIYVCVCVCCVWRARGVRVER